MVKEMLDSREHSETLQKLLRIDFIERRPFEARKNESKEVLLVDLDETF